MDLGLAGIENLKEQLCGTSAQLPCDEQLPGAETPQLDHLDEEPLHSSMQRRARPSRKISDNAQIELEVQQKRRAQKMRRDAWKRAKNTSIAAQEALDKILGFS